MLRHSRGVLRIGSTKCRDRSHTGRMPRLVKSSSKLLRSSTKQLHRQTKQPISGTSSPRAMNVTRPVYQTFLRPRSVISGYSTSWEACRRTGRHESRDLHEIFSTVALRTIKRRRAPIIFQQAILLGFAHVRTFGGV